MTGLSDSGIDAVVTVRRVFAGITLVTTLFLIVAILLFRKYRFPSSRLVLWLSISSHLQSYGYLLAYIEDENPLCDFQAWWSSFFDWAVSLWICVIAFNLFQIVVRKRLTTNYEKWYHVLVWFFSTIFATLPLLGGSQVYGKASAWCWIVKEEVAWRLTMWYGPLIVMFITVTIMYVLIVKSLYAQRSSEMYQREDAEEVRKRWKVSMRLSRYPLIFIIVWIFPIVNRIVNWISGDDILWLVLLHGFSTSVQGTINSIVYCIDEDILYSCTPRGLQAAVKNFSSKEHRDGQQAKPYTLHHSEREEEEGKLKGRERVISLEEPSNDMEDIDLQ